MRHCNKHMNIQIDLLVARLRSHLDRPVRNVDVMYSAQAAIDGSETEAHWDEFATSSPVSLLLAVAKVKHIQLEIYRMKAVRTEDEREPRWKLADATTRRGAITKE